ncbi:MAG: LacI family transcriptional regulator [Treponema sp.]|nr:LacI family transcriptional regulator [Treponema sp.]
MGRNITIRDIAKESGVSISTVSRVLTGNAKVADEKKDKVLRIIQKYDFHPNMLARSLIQTQTMQIGFIVADICNPYYSTVFTSCEKSANAKGYTLLMMDSFSKQEKELELLEKMEGLQVDAIIMLGGSIDSNQAGTGFLERIRVVNSRIPVVAAGGTEGLGCCRIQIDAESAMKKLMDYMVSCGYRKIAFAGGKNEDFFSSWRRDVYRKELERHGLPYLAHLDRQSDYDMEAGYEAATGILAAEERPDAIIAINDLAAIGVLKAISEHGMAVPDDIGLASFDNTYIAPLLTPRLTSVDYGYDAFGEKIISMTIDKIEGKETPEVVYIGSELVVRDSCRSLA